MEEDINKINFVFEKNKFISKIKDKLNLNKEELENIINIVHTNLLISLDTIRPAISLIGK
jgi:nucleoid DNA-binding protein